MGLTHEVSAARPNERESGVCKPELGMRGVGVRGEFLEHELHPVDSLSNGMEKLFALRCVPLPRKLGTHHGQT